MSTEPRHVTKPAAWTAWENQVVNGVFPLRRFIGTSRHGVVFLTEYRDELTPTKPSDAAIKLVPADASRAEAQLAQWQAAATLTHPHLVRVFDVGRCQLGGRGFVFVVMEYAEQTLAQILAKRALTAEEARELLPPALSALACLHSKQWVHGQLKPSNILAVADSLKLSSDSVRPAGRADSGVVRTSLYDPPELREGVLSAAGDMWALGMALVEALTQRTWAGSRGQFETTTSLLASLPAPFSETARRCLSRAPGDRPTAVELEAQYRPALEDEVIADEVLSAPPPSPPTELPRATEAPGVNHAQELTDAQDSVQAREPPAQESVQTQEPEAQEPVQAQEQAQGLEHELTQAQDPTQTVEPTGAQESAQLQELTPVEEPTQAQGTETQGAAEAPGESGASQNLSLASLSLRAIAGAFLLFLGAWAILRS